MSKNVKILLIIGAVLAVLVVGCVGGFALLGYLFVDQKAIDQLDREGAEFGRTTDNAGCQAKVFETLRAMKPTEIMKTVNTKVYLSACLRESRPSAGFCDGLPSAMSDLMNGEKATEAECRKGGLPGSAPCKQVMTTKLIFCETKK